jgi:carboxyl-terminal processing protease
MGLPATALTTPAMAGGPPGLTAVPDVTTVLLADAGAGLESESGRPTLEGLRAMARSLSSPVLESTLLAGGVGYLSIRRFSSAVPTYVFQAVHTLIGGGMETLVIDLRGNLGGEVDAAIRLAADFLEPGDLIATIIDGDGDELDCRAHRSNAYSFPLALLVDAHTASAAELFAGSLKAHGRATVVGERTYGKGEAKMVVAAPPGEPTYGTAATFRLPDGGLVQGVGVEPDVAWPACHASGPGSTPGRSFSDELRDAIASFEGWFCPPGPPAISQ